MQKAATVNANSDIASAMPPSDMRDQKDSHCSPNDFWLPTLRRLF